MLISLSSLKFVLQTIHMNYQNIYNQIIERAKTRQLEGYKEKHHIIPKCIGGNNKKENIVELTAREHFLCHLLLIEIYPDSEKLKYALYLMSIGRCINYKEFKVSSRLYERLKIEFSNLMKTKKLNLGKKFSKKHREKLSKAHLGKKDSKETKNKKSLAKVGHKKDKNWRKNLSESSSKSFGRPVYQKDLKGNIIKEWETGKKASIELNLSYTAINLCCIQNEKNLPRKRDKLKLGKSISCGYIWEYVKPLNKPKN